MHRRVEPRTPQAGTGTLNDPQRLEELEQRRRLSELNARLPPKTTFNQVLAGAPPEARRHKLKRPLSKEKLRPNPKCQPASFGFSVDDDELLLGDEPRKKEKIIVKG